MIEVAGDATRGGDWAYVRLVVDGDRIVDADADGLDTSLIGLTLLEAAAVPGERLVVDALANAIGPVFTASADPERIAVAMSGASTAPWRCCGPVPPRSGSRSGCGSIPTRRPRSERAALPRP